MSTFDSVLLRNWAVNRAKAPTFNNQRTSFRREKGHTRSVKETHHVYVSKRARLITEQVLPAPVVALTQLHAQQRDTTTSSTDKTP